MRCAMLRLVLTLLLAPIVSLANSGTVGCNPGDPGDYATINQAIAGLFANPGPHTITVCTNQTENVEIVGRDGLTIQGNNWQAGQTPTVTLTTCWTGGGPGTCVGVPGSGGPFQATIVVVGSRNITIRGIIVEGASQDVEGISLEDSTAVTVNDVIVQNCGNGDDGSDGWVASGISFSESSLSIRVSTVQNNDTGVVSFNSSPVLRGVTIQNSTFDGLIFQGGTGNVGGATVAGTPRNTVVQNNGFGVAAVNGALVSLGRTDIINNGPYGLLAIGGSRVGLGGGGVSIQGHTAFGILVSDSSLNTGGPAGGSMHQITGNGTGSGTVRAGIFATRNATLGVSQANVSNNSGSGILSDPGSVLRISNSTINGNSEDGIRLLHLSVAHLGVHFIDGNLAPAATTITGNGLAAIACDASSVAFGDLAGISPLQCSLLNEDKKAAKPTGAAASTTDLEMRLQRLTDRRP